MSVRKRVWTTKGVEKSAWLVTYTAGGKRCQATFKTKKEADDFSATTHTDILKGTHIADSESTTVREAGELWIAQAKAGTPNQEPLERTTIDQYRQHLELHIVPFIGSVRLSQLRPPDVRKFEDTLREEGRSMVLAYKVIRSLSSLLADAQERGLTAHNAVRDLGRKRRKGKARREAKLEAGVDFPAHAEIRAIVHNLNGRLRPLIITAIFTGLRASELRGMAWANVDFKEGKIRVRQRADRYNEMGPPKSKAGSREIPLMQFNLNALREWKLACPKGELDLVFPNTRGGIESLGNIINQGLLPAQIAAGVVDKDGKAKYRGMHKLRHFYASWCLNRKADGGMELPPKLVQGYMGHSTITMTMDVYGHLFPSIDVTKELADAELALLA